MDWLHRNNKVFFNKSSVEDGLTPHEKEGTYNITTEKAIRRNL